MAIYRGVKAADSPIAAKVSDQKLIDEMEILSPLSPVGFERIMLFARVICKLQGPLLLVLCVAYACRRSWLKDVEDTFNKIADNFTRYSDMKVGDCPSAPSILRRGSTSISLGIVEQCMIE